MNVVYNKLNSNVVADNSALSPDAEPPAVERELQHINDRLGALVKMMDMFAARLAPVLSPTDAVLSSPTDEFPLQSPLATSLRSTAEALDYEVGRLEQLVRRLEV